MSQSIIPDFNTHTVKNLRTYCATISLPTAGTKADLIGRIMGHYKIEAEIKLRSLLQTPGYAEDDPDGSRKEQEIKNMFDMITATTRQKSEALETGSKQKKTTKKPNDVVQGGIGSHGMDTAGFGSGQVGSKEDKINKTYEAMGTMNYMETIEGGIKASLEEHENYEFSAHAEDTLRKYVDNELAAYADSDAKLVGDTEFQKSGETWEVSRFNYRAQMREGRAAETRIQTKAVAHAGPPVDQAAQAAQLEAELEAEIHAAFDAELEADFPAGAAADVEPEDHDGRQAFQLSAESEGQLQAAVNAELEAEFSAVVKADPEAKQENTYGQEEDPIERAADEEDETYASVEEPIQAAEEEDDDDYDPAPKKKGTRGKAVPKKRGPARKSMGDKRRKSKKKG